MANKRMFTMKIVDSDAFLDMPLSTQCLYFHLNMRADDDGFIDNPKRIARIVGACEDDLKLLIAKRFVLTFENGVIVIKHWRMHNTLSSQRYHETQYLDEKNLLLLKKNGSYSLNEGMPIDDKKQIEMSSRQCRRTKDEQKTNADLDLDIDLDIDIDLDKELDIDKDLNITISKDIVCSTDVQRAVEEWNALSSIGIKPISKLTAGTKRSDSLKARIKQYGIDEVVRAIDRIRDSDFLQGKSTEWIITFDWFVKPNNFIKVLDGNYDNQINKKETTGNAYIDAIKKRVSEVDSWV